MLTQESIICPLLSLLPRPTPRHFVHSTSRTFRLVTLNSVPPGLISHQNSGSLSTCKLSPLRYPTWSSNSLWQKLKSPFNSLSHSNLSLICMFLLLFNDIPVTLQPKPEIWKSCKTSRLEFRGQIPNHTDITP